MVNTIEERGVRDDLALVAGVERAEHRVEPDGSREDEGWYTLGTFTSDAELLGLGLLGRPGHTATPLWEGTAN
ncbi:hypothetical protein [Kutzneria buriramensis]|uniref:hypothetical protein n=1 Tax=Kutzneria buriramensis TaxID=1045776 RepID=UPI0011C0F582|nr:hypothetical protein [Kutzneria buriramensis]